MKQIYESPDQGDNLVQQHLEQLLDERRASMGDRTDEQSRILRELDMLRNKVMELS